MSALTSYAATATVGPVGFRMGGVFLSAVAASASATITDGGTLKIQITASAAQTSSVLPVDVLNGFVFSGAPILATISGSGAVIMIEEM